MTRTTQKRRRRNQRRSEKRACSDTIEESTSVDTRRKRPRYCTESPFSRLHLHITTFRLHDFCSDEIWYQERASVHFTISRSLRLKPGASHDLCQSCLVPAPLNEFSHGGYAGVRLGEARKPQGQSPTRGIEQQKNALLARDVSTKRVTQYRAVRTLSGTSSSQLILRQRRPLFEPQHHHRCQTLEKLLSCGRDSSNRNTFVVLNGSRSCSLQNIHGPRPHAAHGPEEARETTACTAAPSRPCRLCCNQVAVMSPLHFLPKRCSCTRSQYW